MKCLCGNEIFNQSNKLCDLCIVSRKQFIRKKEDLSKFNNQSLNLEILAEEAAEIIQAKSKIIRFGIDDYHPKNKLPNREKLEEEIGHLLKMVDILVYQGTITSEGIEKGREGKIDRLNKWYKE